MVGLPGGVCNGRENVLTFKKSVIPENLLNRSARPEQFEHVRYAHSLAANARLPTALSGFRGDSR